MIVIRYLVIHWKSWGACRLPQDSWQPTRLRVDGQRDVSQRQPQSLQCLDMVGIFFWGSNSPGIMEVITNTMKLALFLVATKNVNFNEMTLIRNKVGFRNFPGFRNSFVGFRIFSSDSETILAGFRDCFHWIHQLCPVGVGRVGWGAMITFLGLTAHGPYYTVLQSTTQYYSILQRFTLYYQVLHSTTPYCKYYSVLREVSEYKFPNTPGKVSEDNGLVAKSKLAQYKSCRIHREKFPNPPGKVSESNPKSFRIQR